jgi:aconitate hydratase
LAADADATYDRTIEIDLSEIEPLAAAPHSPGNVVKVADLDLSVDQVMIGSCTNSSYVDLMTVAEMVKGRTLPAGVSLGIAPGSRQVLNTIARNGALGHLISFGARILESACGFCIGNSQSPKSGAVSLRTSNRNFLGRSGTKDANVYLVSPETAAAAVLTGVITDPRDLEKQGIKYPKITMPKKFHINDGMFLLPPKDGSKIKIERGPNIGEPPKNTPLPETITAEVTIKVGDEITTDHIIPAGAKMKYRSNVPKYSEFLFEVVDPRFYERAKKTKDSGLHNIIIAGLSYGQGSSREHAALCPMYMGVKAVIAKSMERIHKANLINFGIIPLTFANKDDYAGIDQGDKLEIANIRTILAGKESSVKVKNKTKGKEFTATFELSERDKKIILAGGSLNYIK